MGHICIDPPNTNNKLVEFELANVDTFIIRVEFGLMNVDTIRILTRIATLTLTQILSTSFYMSVSLLLFELGMIDLYPF